MIFLHLSTPRTKVPFGILTYARLKKVLFEQGIIFIAGEQSEERMA